MPQSGSGLSVAVSRTLLAIAFARQCLLDSLLLTRLQIESVPLDVLDDVLLEDLTLEAFERALQTLAIVDLNFSQRNPPRFAMRLDSSA